MVRHPWNPEMLRMLVNTALLLLVISHADCMITNNSWFLDNPFGTYVFFSLHHLRNARRASHCDLRIKCTGLCIMHSCIDHGVCSMSHKTNQKLHDQHSVCTSMLHLCLLLHICLNNDFSVRTHAPWCTVYKHTETNAALSASTHAPWYNVCKHTCTMMHCLQAHTDQWCTVCKYWCTVCKHACTMMHCLQAQLCTIFM
jgi:hypothetical protein